VDDHHDGDPLTLKPHHHIHLHHLMVMPVVVMMMVDRTKGNRFSSFSFSFIANHQTLSFDALSAYLLVGWLSCYYLMIK
jgi:hypothetical protein